MEIERQRVADFGAIRRRYAPELAAADDAWSDLDERIESVYREAKRARTEHFIANDGEKRRVLPPEFQLRVDALRGDQRAVSAAAKVHRADFAALLAPAQAEQRRRSTERAAGGGPRVKGECNAAVLKEMLAEDWSAVWKEIAASDDIAHKAQLRARNECGLPTGTYLGIEESFARAKKDAAPRAPSFRGFRGQGKLQVQLRNMSFADLVAGAPACSIRPCTHDPSRKGNQSRMMVVRMDQSIPRGAKQALTLTCKMHRTPPHDAEVKWACLVIRRIGTRSTVEVQFTLEHQSFAEPKRPAGSRVPEHIKVGWSGVNDGIRVAHWPGGEVVVPERILRQHDHANAITSAADAHFVKAKRLLRKWIERGPNHLNAWHRILSDRARADLRYACEEYARFVLGNEQLTVLWDAWVADRKARGEDLYCMPRMMRRWVASRSPRGIPIQIAALAFWAWSWVRKDAHMMQFAIDSERRFEHRRDAFMRGEAIRIATEFAGVTVDDYSIADLKRLDPLTMPGEMVRDRAQAQLHSAAPGRFREILREVMGSRCVPCERSGDVKSTGVARKPRKQARNAPDHGQGAVASAAEE